MTVNASQHATPCPVCNGIKQTSERLAFDDRYGHPGSFRLVHCTDCGHMMTMPRLFETDLPILYGTYYPRKSLTAESVRQQVASVRKPFSRLLRWWLGVDNQGQYRVRAGQRVLDVGCGSGASLLEIQALGAQAWGIEADPNVQVLASALGLRIHQGNLDDRPFPGEAFDLVILNQVIEHIPDPYRALEKVAQRLAPSGRVVLIFPNRDSLWCRLSGGKWINWHIPYHLHHFNLKGFTRLAARSGFRVVRSRTITPNLWTLLQWRANHTPVTQGQANPLWQRDTGREAPTEDQSAKPDTGLSARRLLMLGALSAVAILNRLIDLAGKGDSLMVELEHVERP